MTASNEIANVSAETAAIIATNRHRYEKMKEAGDRVTPRTLPPPTPRDGAPIAEPRVRYREIIPGGWYWTARICCGEGLRILNTSGNPGVSLFAWNAHDPSERYNSADTVKIQWTSEMRKGRVLFSDMGRVLFSIIEDSCAAHDAVVGGSTPASNLHKYGDATLRSTRENFILAAGKHGLGIRDLAPAITFFAPVVFEGDKAVWHDGVVQKDDFVDLRAELDLLVALSNCPHPLASDATFNPGPIEAIIFSLPKPGPEDVCRNATAEAARGFENNARYLQV